MIRRCPNGETWLVEDQSCVSTATRRTETSKYPEEKKSIEIPLVVASENGLAPKSILSEWKCLERHTIECDSHVHEARYTLYE